MPLGRLTASVCLLFASALLAACDAGGHVRVEVEVLEAGTGKPAPGGELRAFMFERTDDPLAAPSVEALAKEVAEARGRSSGKGWSHRGWTSSPLDPAGKAVLYLETFYAGGGTMEVGKRETDPVGLWLEVGTAVPGGSEPARFLIRRGPAGPVVAEVLPGRDRRDLRSPAGTVEVLRNAGKPDPFTWRIRLRRGVR